MAGLSVLTKSASSVVNLDWLLHWSNIERLKVQRQTSLMNLLSFLTNSLEMLPLYCNANCCFIVFFLLFYGYTSVLSFSLFFHSQLVDSILDNISYPMPMILVLFPNFFDLCHCFIERFPIASGAKLIS